MTARERRLAALLGEAAELLRRIEHELSEKKEETPRRAPVVVDDLSAIEAQGKRGAHDARPVLALMTTACSNTRRATASP